MPAVPPLHPIFERVAGIDAVLSPPPDQPLAKNNRLQTLFDPWVPLLSPPFHLETEFAAVPAEIPYLSINPIRTAAWRKRDEAIPCGSWSPIVHTGPGASSIAITRRGIRRRLFRQEAPWNWSEVIDAITQRLAILAGK